MGDEELTAIIQAVRERARFGSARSGTQNGSPTFEGVTVPDLTPLLHARDAAEAKVAAIGTVNPRPPGLKNSIAQGFKKLIARMLDWHIREQVEFNRATMACVQASLDALTELSRGVSALGAYHKQFYEETVNREREIDRRIREDFSGPIQELIDVRRHWSEWRPAFEERRNQSEIHLLRTVSELQAAFQLRVTVLEQSFRQSLTEQHSNYSAALAQTASEIHAQLAKDFERVRGDYEVVMREMEALIHRELRVLRQKQASTVAIAAPSAPAAASAAASPSPMPIEWVRFADAFRGPEDEIRERQKRHARRFTGTANEILDIGCGRGEFLEAARRLHLTARGIDLSEESVALCRNKGLNAEQADLFTYLEAAPDRSFGGAFCCQVVEHLQPEHVPALIRLLGAKLRQGSLVAIETPNPECLAIFATHFYIDPTHTRPVPAALLRFYLEEAGFGSIEVERLAPAAEAIPALKELPSNVVEALFGGLDYAIFARKL